MPCYSVNPVSLSLLLSMFDIYSDPITQWKVSKTQRSCVITVAFPSSQVEGIAAIDAFLWDRNEYSMLPMAVVCNLLTGTCSRKFAFCLSLRMYSCLTRVSNFLELAFCNHKWDNDVIITKHSSWERFYGSTREGAYVRAYACVRACVRACVCACVLACRAVI